MHNLTKKMNVSILNGRRRIFKSKKEKRTRTSKSKYKEEEEEDPNSRKKKLMIYNPRKKHNIDGPICYGLHHKNCVQKNHKFHYT